MKHKLSDENEIVTFCHFDIWQSCHPSGQSYQACSGHQHYTKLNFAQPTVNSWKNWFILVIKINPLRVNLIIKIK